METKMTPSFKITLLHRDNDRARLVLGFYESLGVYDDCVYGDGFKVLEKDEMYVNMWVGPVSSLWTHFIVESM